MRKGSLLHRLEIAQVVKAALVLPIIVAVICSTVLAVSAVRDLFEVRRIAVQMTVAVAISDLIHEQQKERGATAVYLNSGRTAFKQELADQRLLTDQRLANLNTVVDDAGLRDGDDAGLITLLDSLVAHAETRSGVDAGTVPVGEAVRYYTASNNLMLDHIGAVVRTTSNALLSQQMTSFFVLLLAKEEAGLERAIAAGGFAAGAFPVKTLLRLQSRVTEQEFALHQFHRLASAEHEALIDALQKSPEAEAVRRLRAIAFEYPQTMSTQGVTGPDFFRAKTREIELMKGVETSMAGDIAATAEALRLRSLIAVCALIGMILLAGAMVIRFAWIVTRMIHRSITKLVVEADRMGNGDMAEPVTVTGSPDIRKIAEALESLRCSILDAKQREEDAALREAKAREERLAAERAANEAERDRAEKARLAAEEITARDQKLAVQIKAVVSACAAGDFKQRIEASEKEGILAEVCDGVNQIGATTDEGLAAVLEALDAMANGDLTHHMDGQYAGIFDEIARRANNTSTTLNAALGDISVSSISVDTSAREISCAADDLARRTEQNAATLEQTTAALCELKDTVGSVASAASAAKTSAAEISVKANAGQDLVSKACRAMDEIQEATDAIAKILEVIDGIAFQTNLLALNAGVEAARAGESGRGFAVVAAEVRALAQRSSEAARDIAGLIETSGKVVASGVTLVRDSGTALEQIVQSVDEIETRTKSIATAASSAATGVSEITSATGNLDSATQQNAAMFEQTNAAVQSLQAEAAVLAKLVSTFQITNSGQIGPEEIEEFQDDGSTLSSVA